MGQDPDAIRREIEETRERMGETVEALGYKADVPSRAKEKVTGTVSGVKDKLVGAAGSVNESTPSTGDVKHAAKQGASVAQENPLGLAVGSVAVGFLAGMLIPSTRVEDEKLGPVAHQVRDQVESTAQEALQHGKEVAQEVAQTAQSAAQDVKEQAQGAVQDAAQQVKDTAQQSAQEHGQQAAQTAQDNAQSVREQVGT